MSSIIIPFRSRLRTDGVTAIDFGLAATFVRHRPGWDVEQRSTDQGRCLVFRTPAEGWVWTVTRSRAALTLINEQTGVSVGPFADLRALLVELYEAQGDAEPVAALPAGRQPARSPTEARPD